MYTLICEVFFFFSSRRRHTRCREVSWARRCVQETGILTHQTHTYLPPATQQPMPMLLLTPSLRVSPAKALMRQVIWAVVSAHCSLCLGVLCFRRRVHAARRGVEKGGDGLHGIARHTVHEGI
eukprot:TRINITY_DN35140_c0_g1_i2.p3 TRINITY_DN35140_c0_g1~~TRINITY_DN35140_c0_g1_i2.p3  ORF type:complete len:123 (+),score=28.10 TRINITY_DN35140_c0_g1_i2:81-449(+)